MRWNLGWHPPLANVLWIILNSRGEGFRRPIFDWAHEDGIAVIVVGYQQVVVATGGWLWESSRLV
jgi:hypothetical protein